MFQKTEKTSKSNAAPGWFSLKESAAIFGVTAQGFHKSYRPHIPDDAIRADGAGKITINVRHLIDAIVERRAAELAAKLPADPLLTGPATDALEQYRIHRARLAKVEADMAEKTHVQLSELREAVTAFCLRLRRGTDALGRRFGDEAVGIVNDALDEAERNWREVVPDGRPG